MEELLLPPSCKWQEKWKYIRNIQGLVGVTEGVGCWMCHPINCGLHREVRFEHIHYLCATVRREKEDGNEYTSAILTLPTDCCFQGHTGCKKVQKYYVNSWSLTPTGFLEPYRKSALCINNCQSIGWSQHPHWGLAHIKYQTDMSYTRYNLAWLYDLMGCIFCLLYSALDKHSIDKFFPNKSERIYTCCLLTSYGPCGGM